MGYWVSSLTSLPNIFGHYFFLVGDYRVHSRINDFFRNDFTSIADRLGTECAIVAQHPSLEADLQDAIKNIERGELGKMMRNLEKRIPGLLITNTRPDMLDSFNVKMKEIRESVPKELKKEEKEQYLIMAYNENHGNHELAEGASVVYIPFSILERTYDDVNELLADMVAFAKDENSNLIRKTSRTGQVMRHISACINLGIVAINYDF